MWSNDSYVVPVDSDADVTTRSCGGHGMLWSSDGTDPDVSCVNFKLPTGHSDTIVSYSVTSWHVGPAIPYGLSSNVDSSGDK